MLQLISQLQFGLGFFIMVFVIFMMFNFVMVVVLGSRHSIARTYAVATTAVMLWSISMLLVVSATNDSWVIGDFGIRASYATGLMATVSYFYFCFSYVKENNMVLLKKLYLVGVIGVFVVFIMMTDFFFKESQWIGTIENVGINVWKMSETTYSPIYYFALVSPMVAGFYLLHSEIVHNPDPEKKVKMYLMFITLLIGFIPTVVFSLLLTSFGIYKYDWLGPISNVFWVTYVFFIILKYNLMNIRVVTGEILILILGMILFLAMFV